MNSGHTGEIIHYRQNTLYLIVLYTPLLKKKNHCVPKEITRDQEHAKNTLLSLLNALNIHFKWNILYIR